MLPALLMLFVALRKQLNAIDIAVLEKKVCTSRAICAEIGASRR